MLRYKLRTLMILLAVGPPAIAVEWWYWKESSLALLALEVVSLYLILWALNLILWLVTRMYDALCQLISVKLRGVRFKLEHYPNDQLGQLGWTATGRGATPNYFPD